MRMTTRPWLQVGRRNGNSDTDARAKAEVWRETAAKLPQGRIVNAEGCSIQLCIRVTLAPAERLRRLTPAEVVENLHETEASRQAEEERSPGFNKSGQGGDNRSEVLDAVESGEIGEDAIEADGRGEFINAFSWELAEDNGRYRRTKTEALLGAGDHLLRGVAGKD
jgi:hypothetical protein